MSTTVIDRLVVELGLDPKNFTKGQKEAAAAIVDTQKKIAKANSDAKKQVATDASEMVNSLRRVAVEFGALFLAVRSFKDVVGYMSALNESTRQLGIDSRNTGESAASLKDLGNAAEIAGGKAEDATATVFGLQKSIFNAQHGLGYDDQLKEFNRIGVDTGANTGQMRPMVDILRETAKALEEIYPDKAQRYQGTQVLGLQGGMANLVGQGQAEFERLWKEQQSIPQVTPGQTKAAQRLTESYDVLKQRIEAIAREVLTAIEPALEHLFKGIGDFLQKHTGEISKGIESLLGWFSGDGPQHVIDGLIAIGDAATAVAGFISGQGHFKEGGIMAKIFGDKPFFAGGLIEAEKKYGLPLGTLGRENLDSTSRNKLSPDETAAQISGWHQDLGGDKEDPDYKRAIRAFEDQNKIEPLPKSWWQKQIDQYNLAEHPNSPEAQALRAESTPTARNNPNIDWLHGYQPAAGGAGSGVRLNVDTMNVQTQASDVNGIASGIVGALNRKLTVSFSDTALA